ncbi:nucleotide exchange factor GrpE [Alphaproteobacteria bacterium]|nr:nucleotide exchange factor GrpE [Alphaproteobacteria bacterium]
MNEKTNDEAKNNNSMGTQENAGEKIDQTKDQENKILTEESLDKNNTSSDDGSSEKNETPSEEGNLETIDSLKKELSENRDKLLRSLAESENTRKQMEKIREETNKYGVQPLAREILNVVDNFNRALNLKDENNEKSLEEGLTLIQKEILSILDKFNVKKINALGEDFNANFHQAMFEKETNEFEVGKVCEIVQEGYTFHDRLLRPVLVGVAKKSIENNNDKKVEDDENTKNEE